MITLAKKIKEEREKKEKGNNATESPKSTRISVRDKLLTKGKLPVICVPNYCTKYVSRIKILMSVPSSFSKIPFSLAFICCCLTPAFRPFSRFRSDRTRGKFAG